MRSADTSTTVGAAVIEVLAGVGLAHLRADDGRVLGVHRETPGLLFDALRLGDRYRCTVTEPYTRVRLCIRDATADVPLLTVADFLQRARTTEAALGSALVSGRLFGVEINGRLMIPSLYLDPAFDTRQLASVTRALFGLPGASKLQFFTTPNGSLFGLTPLQALARGKHRAVRAAALGFAEI